MAVNLAALHREHDVAAALITSYQAKAQIEQRLDDRRKLMGRRAPAGRADEDLVFTGLGKRRERGTERKSKSTLKAA